MVLILFVSLSPISTDDDVLFFAQRTLHVFTRNVFFT